MCVHSIHLTEASFKAELAGLEAEVIELRAGVVEHRALMKGRDKLIKENQELRTIISTQDEQV